MRPSSFAGTYSRVCSCVCNQLSVGSVRQLQASPARDLVADWWRTHPEGKTPWEPEESSSLSTWHREALGPRFSLSLWKLSEMSKLGAGFRVAQKTCSHRYQLNLRNHRPPGFYYTALNIVNIFEISQVWGYTGLSVYFSSGH